MSNGTMTLRINSIWYLYLHGSFAAPAKPVQREMAYMLREMASENDCDMHLLAPALIERADEYDRGERIG